MTKFPLIQIIFSILFFQNTYSYGMDKNDFVNDNTRAYEFKYKLTIKIDFKKREQILRSKNESPSTYDKAL